MYKHSLICLQITWTVPIISFFFSVCAFFPCALTLSRICFIFCLPLQRHPRCACVGVPSHQAMLCCRWVIKWSNFSSNLSCAPSATQVAFPFVWMCMLHTFLVHAHFLLFKWTSNPHIQKHGHYVHIQRTHTNTYTWLDTNKSLLQAQTYPSKTHTRTHKHTHTHTHTHINSATTMVPFALQELVFNTAAPRVLLGWRNVTVWPSPGIH